MERQELRQKILGALFAVAPDLEGEDIPDHVDLRQHLDIDSVDYLNFIIRLHQELKVEIPEVDYPKLNTLERAVDYLHARL